jgi:signal transduction histidine kinase
MVVNDLILRVSELSLDLRPAMLDNLGLLPSLLWHFERYTAQTRVQVDFKHTGLEGQRWQPAVETAVFRVVQEALTNVARHAQVNQVTVRIWLGHDLLNLQIEDQGAGFDPQAAQAATSGLAGMRERVTVLGGQLTIESAPGSGTCIMAEVPLGNQEDRERT